jgi:hypothetical protein
MADFTRITRAKNVVSQSLPGEEGAVLLHLDTGVYHGLDPVGSRIWELLDSPRTEDELTELMAEDFDATPEILSSDIRDFVESLSERKLVETDGTG